MNYAIYELNRAFGSLPRGLLGSPTPVPCIQHYLRSDGDAQGGGGGGGGGDVDPPYEVTLITPDTTFNISVPAGEYIQSWAMSEYEIDLPLACNSGADSTCAALLTSGTVDQSDQSFLNEDQIAAGFILLCVSYPTSDSVIYTHQEENLY